MTGDQGYGRRALIDAYLATRPKSGHGGYYMESSIYNAALRAHHEAMLAGLERLFGMRLDPHDVPDAALFMLFRSTAESMLALTTPWSGFLEAGLLHRRLEATGEPAARVTAACRRIESRVAESRRDHLLILDELLAVLLGDRAGLTFTAADLRGAGADPEPPNTADFPLFED
jgi:hypothetical protein